MNRRAFAWIYVLGFTTGLLVFFNNCAQRSGFQASSASTQNLAEGVDDPVVVDVNEIQFEVGDRISESTLRSVSSTLADAYAAYMGVAEGKAMAVPMSRVGAVAVGNYNNGGSESERMSSLKDHVLNFCYMRYQSPCILIAVGTQFSISASLLSAFYENGSDQFTDSQFATASIQNGSNLINGELLTLQNMPVVRYNSILTDYLSYSGFKALAISWKGRVVWIGSASGTQTEIDRRAVEYCQVKTGEKCVTFASGANMILSSSSSMEWTLPVAGDIFDVEKIPLISEVTRTTVKGSTLLSNLNNDINTVFYLSEVGQISGSSSSGKTLTELEVTAKANCEASAGSYKCHLYSKNKQVLLDVKTN